MRYHLLLISAVLAVVMVTAGCGSYGPTHTQHLPSSAERSSIATTRPAQERGDLWGDMDTDRQASVGDAIKILRIVVGLDADKVIADANRSGSTDVGDAIKVLRCTVGLDAWPIGYYGGGGAVDISTAIAAPPPTSPTREGPGDTAVSLLETWERALPEDTPELDDMLTDFTNLVQTNPDSSAGQLGLSLALLSTGAENAADTLGYSIFPDVDTQSVSALALSGKYKASRTINKAVDIALFRPGMKQRDTVHPQGQIPDSYLTTEDVQRAIEDHILPVLDNAITRLDVLAAVAPTALLITYVDPDDGETTKIYPADIDLLVAGLQLVRAMMLQLVAYNLDAGSYDWELDLWERDTNGDDILTVAEYAPADPFLTLKNAGYMNDAGSDIQNALQRVLDALDNRIIGDADEVINKLLEGESVSDLRDMTQNTLDLFSGPLAMSVKYAHYDWNTGVWSGDDTDTITLNLGGIWSNPVNDVKDLLPTVTIADRVNEHYKIAYSDWPDPTMNGVFPDAQDMKSLWDADYEYLEIVYDDIEIEINNDYPSWTSPPFP